MNLIDVYKRQNSKTNITELVNSSITSTMSRTVYTSITTLIMLSLIHIFAAAIHEGMNTAEIDKIVYDVTTDMGGIPAPLNYEGYPYSCLLYTSVRILINYTHSSESSFSHCKHDKPIF